MMDTESTSEQVPDTGLPRKCPTISSRYGLVILGFLGFMNLYALRVNLSVAIVAMVNSSASLPENSTHVDVCPAPNTSTHDEPSSEGEFNWSTKIQGIILGSFFYGYICSQILGGWVAQRFGAKHPFGYAGLVSGILALFIPLCARWHYGALIAIRILQGLFQGVCFPSMHTMMGLWAPPLERSRMVSITYSGVQIGTVGSLIISGVLTKYLGWQSVFYFFGGTTIVWYVFWLFLAFDSPNNHPRISDEEKAYIIHSIKPKKDSYEVAFPWKKVIKSVPCWAIIIANFGHNWGFYTLLTNIPTYLNKVLHFGIESNGFLSALPYFVMAIFMQGGGLLADLLRKRKIMTTTWVRRSFHFVGQLFPSLFLILMGYVGCSHVAAIALLTLAVGTDGLTSSGFQVNHVDISPTHAGLLMGVSNTFGTIPGFLGPYVVGVITSSAEGYDLSQWRLVFYISAAIYMSTASFFALTASGELEKWETEEDEPLISG